MVSEGRQLGKLEQDAKSVLLIQSGLWWTYPDRRQVPGWSATVRVQTNVGPETGQREECTASDESVSVKESTRVRVSVLRKGGEAAQLSSVRAYAVRVRLYRRSSTAAGERHEPERLRGVRSGLTRGPPALTVVQGWLQWASLQTG